MTNLPESNNIQQLVSSLRNLIDEIIQLIPEGISEELDVDALIKALAQAEEHSETLRILVSEQEK